MNQRRLERHKDIQFLLRNPGKTLESKYHDAGQCWELIEFLVCRLRIAEAHEPIALDVLEELEKWAATFHRCLLKAKATQFNDGRQVVFDELVDKLAEIRKRLEGERP